MNDKDWIKQVERNLAAIEREYVKIMMRNGALHGLLIGVVISAGIMIRRVL